MKVGVMMSKKGLCILLLITFGFAGSLFSQACSCGGAPLLSSLELPATPAGLWQFGLTYEFSSISDLVIEGTQFDDDTRTRKVHSGRLEIGYGLNHKFSLLAVFSLLQQERTSGISPAGGDFLRTRGIGDGLLMLKYNVKPLDLYSHRQLSVGGGVKFPIGDSNLRRNNTLIAADMQLGTGSWDSVLWGNFYQGLLRYFPGSAYITASYSLTGTNDRFGINNQGYKFGNELVTSAGINYQPQSLFDYTLAIRYRSTRQDKFNNQDVVNTGGKWLFLVPGLNAKISDTFTTRLSGQIPLSRSLNGTQFTTSYTLSVSLFYTFKQTSDDLKF